MPLIRTFSLVLAAATLAAAPATALARGGGDDDRGGDDRGRDRDRGDRIERAGSCDGNATAKIKVKPDDGQLEAEFEVDSNRSGQRWRVTIRRNGNVVVSTNATTGGRSGSFSVERRLSGTSGTITARAVGPSGQVCTARAAV